MNAVQMMEDILPAISMSGIRANRMTIIANPKVE
jgi:hypothetical protein